MTNNAIKYKLCDLAKDLNVNSKDLVDVLTENFGEQKKTQSALTETELRFAFEHYTKNSNNDLKEYFKVSDDAKAAREAANKAAMSEQEKKAEQAKKDAQEKARKSAEDRERLKAAMNTPKPKPVKAAAPQPKVENNPVQQKPSFNNNRPAQQNNRPSQFNNNRPAQQNNRPSQFNNNRPAGQSFSNKPVQNKSATESFEKRQAKKDAPKPVQNSQPKPVQNNKPVAPKPAQPKPQTQGVAGKPFEKREKQGTAARPTFEKTVRIVDTRTSSVDMRKYDERIDSLVPQNVKDYRARKQKFKKNPSRYNRFQPKVETEAQKLQRLELEKARKAQLKITIPDEIQICELATRMKKTSSDVVKKLMIMGEMKNQNEVIDFDTAALIAEEFNIKYEREIKVTIEEQLFDDSADAEENLVARDPVVTVMGHVDHGKTSLLDAIRHAHVTDKEAGGITQHIGAYKVKAGGRNITFIDTPGHAAFTEMRARGANVTDIVVLVVAADDGIMPQTIEAIHHAKAANVSIIVAINKMDKPAANPDKVKQELTEHEIVPEEWGGDVPCIPVSAKTKDGIDDLLEMISLTADVLELKANPDRLAKGTVIEAKLDKGRGPVATLLVQNGTLNDGDAIIAGTSVGRVRAMTDERARKLMTAGPSTPIEIIGLDEVPSAGDIFYAVENEKMARELAEQRRDKEREEANKSSYAVSLDGLFAQIEQGNMQELDIIVKADVQGTAEALRNSLEKLSNEEVRVKVIHLGVGAITDSDIMLASASSAIIVGFNVRPDVVTATNAKNAGVDIRTYSIIYECIEEMESAMKGMLAPKFREVIQGSAEVRACYKLSSVGIIAGCMVKSGKIYRNSQIRIMRDSVVIADTTVIGLKRFKDDVKEVAEGYECGISVEDSHDIKEGDMLEAYTMEEYRD